MRYAAIIAMGATIPFAIYWLCGCEFVRCPELGLTAFMACCAAGMATAGCFLHETERRGHK